MVGIDDICCGDAEVAVVTCRVVAGGGQGRHVSSSLSSQRFLGGIFTIMEMAPARAFSLLKVPTSAFTFKTL